MAKLTQNTRVYGEWAPLTSKSAFVCLNCLNFSIFRYGDRCPRTFSARAFAIVWLLVSMVLFSFFMGTISSILTVTAMRSRTTEVYSGGNKVVRATRLILAPLFHLSSHTYNQILFCFTESHAFDYTVWNDRIHLPSSTSATWKTKGKYQIAPKVKIDHSTHDNCICIAVKAVYNLPIISIHRQQQSLTLQRKSWL